MAESRPHLAKAPAREALIDLRFERKISIAEVDRFVEAARSSFETCVDLVEAVVGIGPDGAPSKPHHSIVGRRLDSQKSHYVLQCRLDGFTLSRLSPYGEWNQLRSEAQRWWGLLSEVVGQQEVSRIAVRYVNAIAIPLPVLDFGDYLTCAPRVPQELAQGISGFLYRVIVPDEEKDCVSIITQALEGPSTPDGRGGAVTVLLDIDVFRTCHDDGHGVWAGLDELREQKNRVFFAHLTEKAMEMFL